MKTKSIKQLSKPRHVQVRVMTIGKKRKEKIRRKIDTESGASSFASAQLFDIENDNKAQSSQMDIERGDFIETLPQIERENEVNEAIDPRAES